MIMSAQYHLADGSERCIPLYRKSKSACYNKTMHSNISNPFSSYTVYLPTVHTYHIHQLSTKM